MFFTLFEKEAYSGKRFSIHEGHKVLKKNNIFLTRHAFHTLYAVLGDARRWKINSCLGVLLTSFAPFFERGFDNYLQHFVVMVIGSSRLSL